MEREGDAPADRVERGVSAERAALRRTRRRQPPALAFQPPAARLRGTAGRDPRREWRDRPRDERKPSDLFTSHRRSIYGLVDRQFLPGTFRAFDFANPDLHIAQRHATTVPQQALFLLNNPFVADRIKAFAARADIVSAATPEERVRRMVRVAFQRSPTESEIATALRFIASGEPASATPAQKPVPSAWSYGWGEYDASAHRVKTFNALPHFTGNAWQGGANWPDAKLGWAQLTADGGHPGDDLAHACVRRWTAARAGAVAIGGEIVHEPDAGDGIRAFVVSGRHGELKSATLRHSRADLSVPRVEVNAGDTIDFVVDIGGGLNSDQFLWAPTIAILETGTAAAWDAKKDFGGPTPKERELLTAWEQYAQGLLLANEFSFVD